LDVFTRADIALDLGTPGCGEDNTADLLACGSTSQSNGLPKAACGELASAFATMSKSSCTSHVRSMSSRSFARTIFETFEPLLPLCRLCSNASASLSGSYPQIRVRPYRRGQSRLATRGDIATAMNPLWWKGTSAHGTGEAPTRGAGAGEAGLMVVTTASWRGLRGSSGWCSQEGDGKADGAG